MFGHEQPSFAVDGRDWPNRETSRFVEAGGLRWHLQRYGEPQPGAPPRPRLLLLHGTGAATHSFRDFGPALAADFDCLAPDLPGHGFTGMPTTDGLSLPGMARLVGELLKTVGFRPDIVVGHSAGAAIGLAMIAEKAIDPRLLIALNGAIQPMRGFALFSPLAKLLFINPVIPKIFAWRAASPDATARIIGGTGSALDARGTALYERLFRRSGHVAGALGMMANWHLEWLQARLRRIETPVVLVAARGDRAVPASDAALTARSLPHATVRIVETGGHLLHEEQPEETARLIVELIGTPVPSGAA